MSPAKKQIKNKQRKQRSKKPARRKNGKKTMRVSPMRMSSCAAHYAAAIGAPFSPQAIGACVPTFPARPSYKVHSRITGTFYVGSNLGYVAIAPTCTNNLASIYVTETNFSGTTLSAGAVGVSAIANSSNAYANGAFIPANQQADGMVGRIVSVGLRIRYIGTELERSGLIYGLVHPAHASLHSFTIPQLSSYRETIRRPVTRSWTTIVASAVNFDESVYPDVSDLISMTAAPHNQAQLEACFPFSGGSSVTSSNPTLGAFIMAFMVTGTQGNAYEYELITHQELVGIQVQNAVSPSHSDQVGLSNVIEIKAKADLLSASNSTNAPYEKVFGISLAEGMQQMAQTSVNVAQTATNIANAANSINAAAKSAGGVYSNVAWIFGGGGEF